jgi:hypothetical protein
MNPFAIISTSLEQNVGRSRSWRDSLRARLPQEKLHEILASLAEGRAWMAELPDGQISVPVLPSSDIRLRAAMFLHEALYGKAVAQTEIQKAEQEAKEFEAVRALNDDELEAEAARIIEARHVLRISQGQITDAEFTMVVPVPAAIPVREADWKLKVWESAIVDE